MQHAVRATMDGDAVAADMEIGEDDVLGVSRDPLGVERVARYWLIRAR